ncbi:TPA: hypothetical protein HA278_07150 [Candidatus Woesearchaeota archaeon]|nr:hypothetical protein [archaeon]HIJ11809.1 hypothetical protein [Candidatus Woesearchaeota archaeon]
MITTYLLLSVPYAPTDLPEEPKLDVAPFAAIIPQEERYDFRPVRDNSYVPPTVESDSVQKGSTVTYHGPQRIDTGIQRLVSQQPSMRPQRSHRLPPPKKTHR